MIIGGDNQALTNEENHQLATCLGEDGSTRGARGSSDDMLSRFPDGRGKQKSADKDTSVRTHVQRNQYKKARLPNNLQSAASALVCTKSLVENN